MLLVTPLDGMLATQYVEMSVVLGLAGAVEMPARQAFITEILHARSHMSHAIALNLLTFNAARLACRRGDHSGGLSDVVCFAPMPPPMPLHLYADGYPYAQANPPSRRRAVASTI